MSSAGPSKEFQPLIDLVGGDKVLESFAEWLGRDDMGVVLNATRSGGNIPKGFSGIAFDGAHWKGYEGSKEAYDSYKAKVQVDGTMNFCQSYACFLWSSKGLVNKAKKAALKAGDYAGNVQVMAGLWLAFFNEMLGSGPGKKWLEGQAKEAKADLKGVLNTLKMLSSDAKVAAEFSTSKL